MDAVDFKPGWYRCHQHDFVFGLRPSGGIGNAQVACQYGTDIIAIRDLTPCGSPGSDEVLQDFKDTYSPLLAALGVQPRFKDGDIVRQAPSIRTNDETGVVVGKVCVDWQGDPELRHYWPDELELVSESIGINDTVALREWPALGNFVVKSIYGLLVIAARPTGRGRDFTFALPELTLVKKGSEDSK